MVEGVVKRRKWENRGKGGGWKDVARGCRKRRESQQRFKLKEWGRIKEKEMCLKRKGRRGKKIKRRKRGGSKCTVDLKRRGKGVRGVAGKRIREGMEKRKE
jgi:hypothetical protein